LLWVDMAGHPAVRQWAENSDAGETLIERVGDAEQLSMLGLELPTTRRGPGRPPGRINLRTERVANWILARYRDPLEGLVAMATMGVADLAAALNCTKLEAFQEIRHCSVAALPYLHQRQAIAVDLTQRRAMELTIVEEEPATQQAANDDPFAHAGLVLAAEELPDVSD
jgi:hypothetical protein